MNIYNVKVYLNYYYFWLKMNLFFYREFYKVEKRIRVDINIVEEEVKFLFGFI